MNQLNSLFRKRIGIADNEMITYEKLDNILEKTAQNIPFENLCIINHKTKEISKDNLIQKMLIKNEGGLCYELNSLLYFFLIENHFNAVLSRGVVYENATQEFLTLGRTHVTILLTHQGETYLMDTGFGANLPLKPVPLTGEIVTSNNGDFRIEKMNTEHGDYVLTLKLKHKDTNWRIGYAFDSKKTITDVSDFNEVQTIITDHQDSPFNKNPLITRITNEGNITLTNTSFTQWVDGIVKKVEIDNERFKELTKEHFGMDI